MKLTNIVELVSSLRHAEMALCESIKAEEDHASVRDPDEMEYPTEARLMHRRLENIRATIDRLETELALARVETEYTRTRLSTRDPISHSLRNAETSEKVEPKVSG